MTEPEVFTLELPRPLPWFRYRLVFLAQDGACEVLTGEFWDSGQAAWVEGPTALEVERLEEANAEWLQAELAGRGLCSALA